jgi:hypothetical protein
MRIATVVATSFSSEESTNIVFSTVPGKQSLGTSKLSPSFSMNGRSEYICAERSLLARRGKKG